MVQEGRLIQKMTWEIIFRVFSGLKLLDDEFAFGIESEIVGLEDVAGVERLQVLNVDLASLKRKN